MKLLNWPIQCYLRRQQSQHTKPSLQVAIHTPLPIAAEKKSKRDINNTDLKFVRELFPVARSGPTIVFVSDAAWAAGIRPGMPLAEARSMLAPTSTTARKAKHSERGPNPKFAVEEASFVEWTPSADQRDLKAIAELVRRFAPIIGIDESPVSDSLLLDITGCAPLFGGEAALAEQLLKRLQQHRLECRVSISDSVATAWAFSHVEGHTLLAAAGASLHKRRRHSKPEWDLPVIVIPPQQAEVWLHKLPVAAARIPISDINVLSQLGILNLKQLFQLPIEDLPARLSAAAVRRLQQICGTDDELIASIPEADPVAATWVSEFPVSNTGEIQQVLEYLVDDIAEQLQRRCVGAIRLTCRLKPEEGSVVPLIAEVVKPLQSANELLEVLLLRLEFLRVPPTLSVTLRATVAPLPIARQQDLFSPSEHIEPTEELASVVNRISNRLGRQSLLTAEFTTNPVPEHSILLRPLIEGSAEATIGNIGDRLSELVTPETPQPEKRSAYNLPLRLLAEAAPLGGSGANPLTAGIRWNGMTHAVTDINGPERIQTDWWNDSPVHRDYYRVTVQSGSTFWIYLDITSDTWHLHGVFD